MPENETLAEERVIGDFMDKICCDYKWCDNHSKDGECDMVGLFIDENGRCGKMFPATQRHLSEASTRPENAALKHELKHNLKYEHKHCPICFGEDGY